MCSIRVTVPTKKLSESAKALRDYLTPKVQPPMSQSELARRLGVSPQAVWNWINGTSKPNAVMAEAIARIVTNASVAGWLDDEERKQVEKLAKAANGDR